MLRLIKCLLARLLPVLGYLYLCRVPLIAALIMLAFPWLSWLGPTRSLTVGAYEVKTFWQSALACVGFMVAGGCVVTTAEIYGLKAGSRYPGTRPVAARAFGLWRCFAFLNLPNIVWMILASSVAADGNLEWTSTTTEIFLGALLGVSVCIIIGGGTWTQLPPFRPLMGLLHRRLPRVAAWLSQRGIIGENIELTPLARLLHSLRAAGFTWRGILQPQSKHPIPAMEEGHGRAIIYTILLASVYGLCLIAGSRLEKVLPPVTPVFFLIGMAGMVLGFLAYLLDRHRVPLLVVCITYCAVMGLWRESDHYYSILPPVADTPAAPASATAPDLALQREYLSSQNESLGLPARLIGRAGFEKQPVVIVTMAGGGIQAAAWPLVALEKIEETLPGFHKGVRMVSGVSGGSVGALYYAAAYDGTPAQKGQPAKPNVPNFQGAVKAGMASSLSNITVATMRDDLLKVVAAPLSALPFGPSVLRDRGLALELSLRENARENGLPSVDKATLLGWQRDALLGRRPALILNGTVVESGERMAYSTVPRNPGRMPGSVEFAHRYQSDIGLATAARMSATFPVVSPAARPLVTDGQVTLDAPLPDGSVAASAAEGPAFPRGGSYQHVVDGGYFENSAVVGAISWLEEAFDQLNHVQDFTDPATGTSAATRFAMPPHVMILQISGFPDPRVLNPVDKGESSRGAIFDVVSPGMAVVSIRDSVQAAFSSDMVHLFAERWSERTNVLHVDLRPKISDTQWDAPTWKNLGFVPNSPPLSWHLRTCEQAAIRNQDALAELMEDKAKADQIRQALNRDLEDTTLAALQTFAPDFVDLATPYVKTAVIRQTDSIERAEQSAKEATADPLADLKQAWTTLKAPAPPK